jgi:hypothetical protein
MQIRRRVPFLISIDQESEFVRSDSERILSIPMKNVGGKTRFRIIIVRILIEKTFPIV